MKILLKLQDLANNETPGVIHSDDPRWPAVLRVITPTIPPGQESTMAPMLNNPKIIEYVRCDALPEHLQDAIVTAIEQRRF
jgi:hypothetical protein